MPSRRDFGEFIADAAVAVAQWLRGQILIAAILTAIYALGFALLRMPLWPLVAVICGCLHLVPFIGAVLALAIAGLVMMFADAGVYRLLGVLGVYVFAQALEGFYLTPRILGARLRMPPWAVFIAILAGGALFGPLGILLAAPVTAILLLAWRRFGRTA